MRKIKFRVWKQYDDDGFFITEEEYIKISQDGDVWQEECDDITDRATVEQYTGLKDRNGKEIYEGDIMKIYNNTCILANSQKESEAIHFVDWGHLGFKFTLVNGSYMQGCGINSEPEYEVIGNIHENPELLK